MKSISFKFTLCLILGIFLGAFISFDNTLIFVLSFFIVSLILKLAFKKQAFFRCVIVFLIGFGIFSYHYSMSDNIRSASEFKEKYVTVYGIVYDMPQEYEDYTSYILRVRRIDYKNKTHMVEENIVFNDSKKYEFGDSVRAEGFLNTFSTSLNHGDFDSARSHKAKDIYFKMYAYDSRLSDTKFKCYKLTYFINSIKNIICKKVDNSYTSDSAAIMKAVLTGSDSHFSPEFRDTLNKSNTMRLFYPAYVHIFIIVSMVGLLSNIIKRNKRQAMLIVLLFLYAIYSSDRPYILKTVILLSILYLLRMKLGYSNYITSLSITIGILLLDEPLLLYHTGFVLSVSANILIYYFVPLLSNRLTYIKPYSVKRYIALWLTLTIGMLPLQAYYFYSTSPYSMLLSFLYMPILSALFILEPVNMLLSGTLVSPFSFISNGLLYFMKHLPKYVTKLPFYTINIKRPHILAIVFFYLGLFLLYRLIEARRKDKTPEKLAAFLMCGILVFGTVSLFMNKNNLTISFVNVGQGDGAVLSIPFNETIIIDGGGSTEKDGYDYGEKVFLPYLRREGYTNIDLAIVSHYHSDHTRGIIAAMKYLNVKEVLIPDCMENNEYRLEIEKIARDKNIKITKLDAGHIISHKSGLTLKIISPNEKDLRAVNENNTSYSIKAEYFNSSVLFTGDITANIETKHSGEWGKCDILKVAHHGSASSSHMYFLKEVSPEVAIISVGENNPYFLPSTKTLKRFEDMNIPVYRTDKNGDITVTIKKNSYYSINTYK